jgi:hypothetical protein
MIPRVARRRVHRLGDRSERERQPRAVLEGYAGMCLLDRPRTSWNVRRGDLTCELSARPQEAGAGHKECPRCHFVSTV